MEEAGNPNGFRTDIFFYHQPKPFTLVNLPWSCSYPKLTMILSYVHWRIESSMAALEMHEWMIIQIIIIIIRGEKKTPSNKKLHWIDHMTKWVMEDMGKKASTHTWLLVGRWKRSGTLSRKGESQLSFMEGEKLACEWGVE